MLRSSSEREEKRKVFQARRKEHYRMKQALQRCELYSLCIM